MEFETPNYKNRAQATYRFDPWMAEVEAMNQSAANMAVLVAGIGTAIKFVARGLGRAVQALRKAAPIEPIEVQVVHVTRSVPFVAGTQANDRAAA